MSSWSHNVYCSVSYIKMFSLEKSNTQIACPGFLGTAEGKKAVDLITDFIDNITASDISKSDLLMPKNSKGCADADDVNALMD